MNIFHLQTMKQKPSFKKIRYSFPDYFSKELNLSTLSDYQALRILEDFNKASLLDLEIQKSKSKKRNTTTLGTRRAKRQTTYTYR